MANRFILNERSYHGKGAIQEIAGEVTSRGLKKALLCTDPDLQMCIRDRWSRLSPRRRSSP